MIALTCAAVDDVTAWCLLAFVVGVVQASAGQRAAGCGADARLHRVHVRRGPARGCAADSRRSMDRAHARSAIALDVGWCCCRLTATEAIGVHAIFGAFLLGAVIPHDSALARALKQQSGKLRDDPAAAGVLCVHRHADRDRPAYRAGTNGWSAG